MRVTFKYKVYKQTQSHQRKLNDILFACNCIYNHCIALHRRYYKFYGKYASIGRMKAHIAKLRRANTQWQLVNSQSVQDIVERIDKGYQLFFNLRKMNPKKRSPKFHKFSKGCSVLFKQSGWKLNGNDLYIVNPKDRKQVIRLGFFYSRPLDGNIQTITLKRDKCGDYWLVFVVRKEVEPVIKFKTGKTAGFDFGLKNFLTSSDGERIAAPTYLGKELDNLKKRSRKFSKTEIKSHSHYKKLIALAKAHRNIADKRNNFQWKLAYRLVSEYDTLCFESLDLLSMNVRGLKKAFKRKLSDYAFGSFLQKVEYLCNKYGKTFCKIDKYFASSQLCYECSYRNRDVKDLKVRQWECPKCGTMHDRDINAARNIQRVGMSALGGGCVRLASASCGC